MPVIRYWNWRQETVKTQTGCDNRAGLGAPIGGGGVPEGTVQRRGAGGIPPGRAPSAFTHRAPQGDFPVESRLRRLESGV
jgi:hypothetical protein